MVMSPGLALRKPGRVRAGPEVGLRTSMPSFRIFAGSAPARGRREALVRSFASVPRAGPGLRSGCPPLRRSHGRGRGWPDPARPGLVVGDGLGVGVSGDELGDGGAVPPPRTRITAL